MTNVLPFQPAETSKVKEADEDCTLRPKFSFDVSQPDGRGFVLIDACVPMSLAVEFMNLVTEYNLKD